MSGEFKAKDETKLKKKKYQALNGMETPGYL